MRDCTLNIRKHLRNNPPLSIKKGIWKLLLLRILYWGKFEINESLEVKFTLLDWITEHFSSTAVTCSLHLRGVADSNLQARSYKFCLEKAYNSINIGHWCFNLINEPFWGIVTRLHSSLAPILIEIKKTLTKKTEVVVSTKLNNGFRACIL